METVASRARTYKQPRGGFIKPSQFSVIRFDDGQVLPEENIHASVTGMVIDYLTRYLMGTPLKDAFSVSILGYGKKVSLLNPSLTKDDRRNGIDINTLLDSIKGIDDTSIVAACKAVTYDVWFRNPLEAAMAKGPNDTNPDRNTIESIRVMVNRCLSFWEKYGPIVEDGFTFEPNGYTDIVSTGDGDFLTKDTLWDFKVTKQGITNKHTLQLVMYWIMGHHSGNDIYRGISKIGIFNPRLNTAWILDTNNIPVDVIEVVERDVIGYK